MQYLLEQMATEIEELALEVERVHEQEGDCKPLHETGKQKYAELQNLKSFFGVLLRTELGLSVEEAGTVGVRNGFVVVTVQKDDGAMNLLEQILGDGRIKMIPIIGGGMSSLGLDPRGD
ncbi:MAG: hypothetical protein AAB490_01425 [Patescibacteria group bacterium]